jgi:MraW methylase family
MLPSVLQPNETDHVPVLAEEVRELLAIEPGDTVVDATFGAGGHAAVLAADLRGEGRFIAIDRDPTVRPYFEGFRRHAGVQSRFLRGEASVVLDQLAENGVHADAILLDLGVSSMQIDRPERGFSYAVDAPLDMRMDPTAELSAAELVNEASERELTTIFRQYGEERYAKQIARAIGRRRKKQPIERTDRGQRRVGRARGGAAGRARDASARRAAGRDRVPLARGPDRQALLPEARARLCLPARLSRLRLRSRARAAATEPEGDPPELARAGPQPARSFGQAARRSEGIAPWPEPRQPARYRHRRARARERGPSSLAGLPRDAVSRAASSGSSSWGCSWPESSPSTSRSCA